MIRVYLITDRRGATGGLSSAVAAALSGLPAGGAAVQLREKDLCASDLFELARALLPLCRVRGAPLLVNDRADVARAVGAEGVHLPASGALPPTAVRELLGPRALVGRSCHSVEEVREAARAGADFCVFGPVWETPSKAGFGPPVGVEALAVAAGTAPLPVFAIGGVDPERARRAMAAGARGVACIRTVLAAADPAAAALELWRAVTD